MSDNTLHFIDRLLEEMPFPIESIQSDRGREFYSTVEIDDPKLIELLDEWSFFYDWHRPYGSLNGRTLVERFCELIYQTPIW